VIWLNNQNRQQDKPKYHYITLQSKFKFTVIRKGKMMPSMLVTVKISKGFKTWTEMAKSMEEKAGAEGAKIIWAATNPDESSVYVMMDVPNPDFMQTFGLRPDVVKAREEAGADVSSTTVITPIGDYWLGN
jgi:hypothetical protein